ncbi:MAG: IS1595 family transposase [bacterium]|nr:IS1595 family transposase [bacterium]
MEKYPADMMDFMDMFSDEAACLEYLSIMRWPDGYECQRCGGRDAWKMGSGLYRCRDCRYAGSVISGTLFENTRKPLRLWFQAIWYVVSQKNGVSALGLQKALGLGSYHTAWEWLHKLRRAMVRPGRDRLGGIVEMDETVIGGIHEGRLGRGDPRKALVLVAAQDTGNGIGRIRLACIPDASGETLLNSTLEMVEPGTTIRTDGWRGYNILSSHGYVHEPCVHKNASDKDATPAAHLVASLLKRWLLGTHQGAVSHEHLPYYLDEFTFRFNRRTSRSRGKLFYRIIEQALQIGPVPAKALNTTSGR